MLRRNRRRRNNNNSNNNHRHHHHHAKSSNSRGGKKDQDGGGDETNDEEDDYYDDRALDKGGWRIPGVLDYRDELFLESDDDLAFGYYDEEEENEETEEDDDGEWVDEEEDESNVYRYGHDDTMERGEGGNYHASDGFQENNLTWISLLRATTLMQHQWGTITDCYFLRQMMTIAIFVRNSPSLQLLLEKRYLPIIIVEIQ